VHKLAIQCQVKMAEEITQIANMTPLKDEFQPLKEIL
jgi:hypothetical protein